MATKKQKKGAELKYASVPLTRRFIAYMMDWYIGALCTGLPIAIVSQKQFGSMMNQNLVFFDKQTGIILGLVAIAFALFYFVVVPTFVWPGQTPGKRIMKMKVVQNSGEEVSIKNMLLRQVIGMMIIEGIFLSVSGVALQLITIASGFDALATIPIVDINVKVATLVGFVFSAVSIVLMLFKGEQRSLHDYIGNTKVVDLQ